MGKMKQKKLDKDIKELEQLEGRFHDTRNKLLNYSIEQRRSISHPDPTEYTITTSSIDFGKISRKVDTKLEESAAYIARECIVLLAKKHQDYGPSNINEAPGGALNGLNVRLHDKVARLSNLLTKKQDPNYESIRDTFVDIVNYGIISIMILDNKWDTTK